MKGNGTVIALQNGIKKEDSTKWPCPSLLNISKDADQNQEDENKIKLISDHFTEIMRIMGLNMNDESIQETPGRIARMYIKEIFSGLNPANKPAITLVERKNSNRKLVIEKNISLHSYCEHHFLPITGKAHVAYISNGKVIGLHELNRIIQYHSRKPQLQQRLTEEIVETIKEVLETTNVALIIDGIHFCASSNGINDANSSTITSHYSGKFLNDELKHEFLLTIK